VFYFWIKQLKEKKMDYCLYETAGRNYGGPVRNCSLSNR